MMMSKDRVTGAGAATAPTTTHPSRPATAGAAALTTSTTTIE